MKRDVFQLIWMIFLIALVIGLAIWSIWFVADLTGRIQIFGIVGIIIAAVTSVLTVSINNRKAREREYELLILREKQKVYSHFYDALFESISRTRKGPNPSSSKQKEKETDTLLEKMMEFKRGLMNWGSEELIEAYLSYENLLLSEEKDPISFVKETDKFLKRIRVEMGYRVSNNLSLINILLTPEARDQLKSGKVS